MRFRFFCSLITRVLCHVRVYRTDLSGDSFSGFTIIQCKQSISLGLGKGPKATVPKTSITAACCCVTIPRRKNVDNCSNSPCILSVGFLLQP